MRKPTAEWTLIHVKLSCGHRSHVRQSMSTGFCIRCQITSRVLPPLALAR